ncbi:hypothetical protein SEVIR_5G386800v4 [Setaria viridis]|uniref:Uncharacterized protein n=1 Tax=Setaria viridis TaxID=4556 RepID=A0A4U6UQZ2_SETVI|nr:hypothetical protein SEVIR_5G386800v2 [Setaria viridis]
MRGGPSSRLPPADLTSRYPIRAGNPSVSIPAGHGASSGKAGVCIRRKAPGDGGEIKESFACRGRGARAGRGGRRPPSSMVDTLGCRAGGRGMGELGRDKEENSAPGMLGEWGGKLSGAV